MRFTIQSIYLVASLLILSSCVGGSGSNSQDVKDPNTSQTPTPAKETSDAPAPTDDSENMILDPSLRTPQAETPSNPQAETPSNPQAETPSNPQAETPSNPQAETPSNPQAETPSNPQAETPSNPPTQTLPTYEGMDNFHKPTEPDTSTMGQPIVIRYITVLDADTANLVNQTSAYPQSDDKLMMRGQATSEAEAGLNLFENSMCFIAMDRPVQDSEQFQVIHIKLKYQKYVFILTVEAKNAKGESFNLSCLSYKAITAEMVKMSFGQVLKLQ